MILRETGSRDVSVVRLAVDRAASPRSERYANALPGRGQPCPVTKRAPHTPDTQTPPVVVVNAGKRWLKNASGTDQRESAAA